MRKSIPSFLALVAFLGASFAPADAARTWQVDQGTATLAFDDSHLSDLGLRIVGERATASAGSEAAALLAGSLRSFAVDPHGLSFMSDEGSFRGFGGSVSIPVSGGFAIGGKDGATTPVFLYDFRLDVDLSRGNSDAITIRTADPALPQPFVVANAGFLFRENLGELAVCFADLQVSPEWAQALGRPYLAGQWVGTLDLRLHASAPGALERRERMAPDGKEATAPLDVTLGELYGIASMGRTGLYPNGKNGLSFATTSCNTGGVIVPWNGPMAETHPFIGLALFRVKNGVLQEVGTSWIKHGFFALSNDDCNWGCPNGSDGSYLALACSDTYSTSNNASQFYLGPRTEVNPFLAVWEACGSFFDEPTGVPDGGCGRSYNGSEPNGVNHRLEVWDEDLGNMGATYYYEGIYYVAGDTQPDNGVGWRQCTMGWSGSNWTFNTVGGGVIPVLGPVVETWGDESHRQNVASDDGPAILSVKVTDLGGGVWHYDYALYNYRSERCVNSFSVPLGGVTASNLGFHDIDKTASNDWTATVANGSVTWTTEDFVTNPNANALRSQFLFNFSFDANRGPVAGQAQGGVFKPGAETTFFIDSQVPDATGTAAAELREASSLALASVEPNPFDSSTRITFTLPRREQARLSVVDVTGRTVRVLLDGIAPAGSRDARWDGRDNSGQNVASGIYLLRLETADGVRTAKVARMR